MEGMNTGDLLADIGGTNARVTFRRNGNISTRVYLRRTADFASLDALLADAIAEARAAPRRAVVAVPGPVVSETLTFANLPWRFARGALKDALGVDALHLVNDLQAVALSLPVLAADDRVTWRAGDAAPAARVVVAPGTGLGVSALVPGEDGRDADRWVAVAGEGGHALAVMPRATPHDLRTLWADAPSWEDLLSGGGLLRIYRALGGDAAQDPSGVTAQAARNDACARAAIGFFSELLGVCAGDMAIVFGAKGGCYIAGGVVPALGDLFDVTRFAAGFSDKGPYRAYAETIPLHLIAHPYPALLGLGALIDARFS